MVQRVRFTMRAALSNSTFLNDKGVRNMLGGKMTHSSVNTMLKNRRYMATPF